LERKFIGLEAFDITWSMLPRHVTATAVSCFVRISCTGHIESDENRTLHMIECAATIILLRQTPGGTISARARRHMDPGSFLQGLAWLPRSCAGAKAKTDFLCNVERPIDYTVCINDKYIDFLIDVLLN